MIVLWLMLLVSVVPVPVRVVDRQGENFEGTVLNISVEQVTMLVDGERQTLPLDRLSRLEIVRSDGQAVSDEPSTGQPVGSSLDTIMTLSDGSIIRAKKVTSRDGTLRAEMATQPLVAPSRMVRHVRFRGGSKATDAEWNKIAQRPLEADLIVVRRAGDQLRAIEGIVGDIDSQDIRFQYDGEWIDVNRNRVEGVIYYAGRQPIESRPVAALMSEYGSRWNLAHLSGDTQTLQIRSVGGVEVSLPWSDVQAIDFASAATQYLSDMKPERVEWTPYVAFPPLHSALERMMQPQMDRGFDHPELTLTVPPGEPPQQFRKGLAIHSRTTIVYRLRGEYRTFSAVAGLEESNGPGGDVHVVIYVDSQPALQFDLTAEDAPRPIDLQVSGAQRMTILVDFGRNGDVGDRLILGDARLMR